MTKGFIPELSKIWRSHSSSKTNLTAHPKGPRLNNRSFAPSLPRMRRAKLNKANKNTVKKSKFVVEMLAAIEGCGL